MAISSPIRVTPDREGNKDKKGGRRRGGGGAGDKERVSRKRLSVKDRLFVSKKKIGTYIILLESLWEKCLHSSHNRLNFLVL